MVAVNETVSTRQLREGLAEVIGRAAYAHERVGITRHGKLAAVVISVEDLEALEAFEMARDVEEFRAARRDDDGGRVSLDELRAELAE
ncbi:type II toxin-antitoxin system Phd/YefM family antitoxin [Agromyces sp. Marseille-P2726]|uniref:type II toxin-antitoxin system Phd/YefM family antitoxin n=1 Tax=Agromyces sp. Marseille-P2726 TaxID=2709132 RepID=UPI00156DF16B|nr:type II toxin-antitoxin system Phd/YefM family antitoxin [Agromyces sp. Marseille-P2726]